MGGFLHGHYGISTGLIFHEYTTTKTMKPNTLHTVYWIVTILFALMMLVDGAAGLAQQKEGQEAFQQLGYPLYVMTIVGTAKILGAIALLQNKFSLLKEWAFAGFAINFVGASASWAFVGAEIFFVIFPLMLLLVMLLVYVVWKKREQTNHSFVVG